MSAISNPEKTRLAVEFKHDRPLTNCWWDPQNRYLFFGAEDNFVHRYDVSKKECAHLSAHDSWVRAFGVTADGKTLATGGYDGRLALWAADGDASVGPKRVLEAHQGWIRALAISPDGQSVATCGNDNLVKLWSIPSGDLIRSFEGHKSHVYNVTFTQDGSALLTCDLHGRVKHWSTADAAQVRDVLHIEAMTKYDTVFRADIGGARSMALNADGSVCALGGITNVTNAFAGVGEVAVALVDWQGDKLKQLLETKEKLRGTAWGIASHPDGYWVGLSGGSGGHLFFWKGDTAHEFFKLKLKTDGRGMALAPDARQVAVAHSDMVLRIYDLT